MTNNMLLIRQIAYYPGRDIDNLKKLGIIKKDRGYTLIEVLVSIALLGIISSALFLSIGTAMKITVIMGKRQKAVNLAHLQMEWVKQQIGLLTNYDVVPEADSFLGYLVTTEVADVGIPPDNARDNDIQKIIIKVTYNERFVTLEGYKTR
jgi:prepilin-type N-terminal cleavage/methylation domain-containing protein